MGMNGTAVIPKSFLRVGVSPQIPTLIRNTLLPPKAGRSQRPATFLSRGSAFFTSLVLYLVVYSGSILLPHWRNDSQR